MGHKHSKEEILDSALTCALEGGLSQLSFGRVAKRLDINDRTVVYYFPTKDDLITEVVVAMGLQVQGMLQDVLDKPVADHLELTRIAWPVLAHVDVDPTFALFLEANGLAAAGREPFKQLVPLLVDGWIAWAADFIEGPPNYRRTEAETTIALLDGLWLLRALVSPAAATRAAKRLGVA